MVTSWIVIPQRTQDFQASSLTDRLTLNHWHELKRGIRCWNYNFPF